MAAFFIFPRLKILIVTMGLFALPITHAANSITDLASCRTQKYDAEVAINNVIDGDTVRLKGGRLLRFMGLNTPEIDHEGPNTEAFAILARKILAQQIGPQKRLKLIYGKEKHDRYGRLLAHVFTLDGRNIQATILSMGLAHWIVVPPNIGFRDCYRQAEQIAQRKKRNLWSAGAATALVVTPSVVTPRAHLKKGFTIIEGSVQRSSRDKKGLSLHLSDLVVLRVATRYIEYFADGDFNSYKQNVIRVRGWLYPRKGGWQMSLKHPDSVQVLHSK